MAEFTQEDKPIEMVNNTQNPSTIQTVREFTVGAGSDVVKINAEGLFIGSTQFSDAPFRVTFKGSVTANDITLTGGTIKAGQTAYNTGTGYWIGTASGTQKFSIGNGSTKYVTWDGSTLSIRGSLNADDITAGTITGRTLKATGSGSGIDVWVENSGYIRFRYNGSNKAWIASDSSGNLILDSDNVTYCTPDTDFIIDPGDDVQLDPSGDTYITSGNLYVTNGQIWADDYNYNDFAEYFEATEEFSKEKIPAGTPVVLVNEKIRPAKKNEIPFGVISDTAAIRLGEANRWHKKFLQTETGATVYEKVHEWKKKEFKDGDEKNGIVVLKGVVEDGESAPDGAMIKEKMRKKINPEFDPSKEFILRRDRQEWNVVGLLGKVRILKGSPTDPRWIKMRELSENFDEWFIR